MGQVEILSTTASRPQLPNHDETNMRLRKCPTVRSIIQIHDVKSCYRSEVETYFKFVIFSNASSSTREVQSEVQTYFRFVIFSYASSSAPCPCHSLTQSVN